MYEQHWRYMSRIIELGDGPNVYARYNTNLSRIEYRGVNLYESILSQLRDWQICASLDGTGRTGEYIRTGLNYESWLENFKEGLKYSRHPRQMRIDFTLTLPGLFEVENISNLGNELGVDILAKVVFAFSPNIILSPLALPRPILNRIVDQLLPHTRGAMQDILMQLKNRPTFAEQWPDTYQEGLSFGKRCLLRVEEIRQDKFTLADILKQDPEIYEWYENIPT